MHVLADLRAGADGRPGVDHRPLADIGAEIDEGGHQHRIRCDIGGAADHAVRNGAEPGLLELVDAPAVEFGGNLVPPDGFARSASDEFHRIEAEGEEHRLLEPLVDRPGAVLTAFSDAYLAAVEQVQRRFHGVANRAAGAGVDGVAPFESGLDRLRQGGEVVVRHRKSFEFGVVLQALLHNSPNRNRLHGLCSDSRCRAASPKPGAHGA